MIYDEAVFISEGGVNRYVIGGDGEMMVRMGGNPSVLTAGKFGEYKRRVCRK